jgi:FO synthase
MSYEEMARLKQASASMGIMLETSSDRLGGRGMPHFNSPDKVPAVRMRTIADAGRLAIPFTTGILVGIGETSRERAESLIAIRDVHRRYRHVQEVIVQNFRAKPRTAMHDAPEPDADTFLAAVAAARVVMGPRMHVQAPPNLSDEAERLRLLDAGIDDWGGVSPLTPDHVNPEKPWPAIEHLAATTAARGLRLRERLTIYPEFAARPDPYLAAKMRAPVEAVIGPDGLAAEGLVPTPIAWQDPEVRWKPRQIALTFAKAAGAGLREDAEQVYGDFDALEVTREWAARDVSPERLDADIRGALTKAAAHRPITDGEALALFAAEGPALEALTRVADDLRAEAVGDEITYVINRNINFTNVCYVGCRFCAFAQREQDRESYTLTLTEVADRAEEAWERGASEICMQGGIHPDLPGSFYLDLLDAVKARVPDIHIHAFSPMEILNGATKLGISFAEFLSEARAHGLGSIPGTAAEILDDEVRWVLTKGKLPATPGSRSSGRRTVWASVRVPRSCTATSTRRRTGWRTSAGSRTSRTTRAGSPSSSRCRSSTRTRRSISRARRVPARPSRKICACTRSLASCWTELSPTSKCRGSSSVCMRHRRSCRVVRTTSAAR